MKTKVIIIGVITALLLAVTFKLKSNKHLVSANIYRPDARKKVLVQGVVAQRQQLHRLFTYTGTFSPNREVMLIPQLHGEVEGIFFDEGDQVKQGALLVQIDDDLLQAQHISALANYENARQTLSRYQNASLSGGVSRIQLDNLRLSLTNAESQLKQLTKQIEQSRIVAPFAGTITQRDVELGSVVGGQAVARLTELAQLKLEISVPEKQIIYFKEGESAEIQTDIYPGRSISGTIEYVSDRADNTHNYDVSIKIENRGSSAPLKAGMYGTALLRKELDENALVVPRAALLGSAKNPQLYVIERGRAVLTDIQTGEAIGESIEVVQGLQEGDTVVTTGHINLSSASLVEIIK